MRPPEVSTNVVMLVGWRSNLQDITSLLCYMRRNSSAEVSEKERHDNGWLHVTTPSNVTRIGRKKASLATTKLNILIQLSVDPEVIICALFKTLEKISYGLFSS